MNVENIDKAVAVMKRAAIFNSINMTSWQTANKEGLLAYSEENLHLCGNKACFAGYLALSPEWKNAGGTPSKEGCPSIFLEKYPNIFLTGVHAIAFWLDVPLYTAQKLVLGGCSYIGNTADWHSEFYNKRFSEVIAQDVIEKLLKIRSATPEIYGLENEDDFLELMIPSGN